MCVINGYTDYSLKIETVEMSRSAIRKKEPINGHALYYTIRDNQPSANCLSLIGSVSGAYLVLVYHSFSLFHAVI